MEATEFFTPDFSDSPAGPVSAVLHRLRVRATSAVWAAADYCDGLSPVIAVRYREAVIKMQSAFAFAQPLFRYFAPALDRPLAKTRPRLRQLTARRAGTAAAGIAATLVLVIVPTSAISQHTQYTAGTDTSSKISISSVSTSLIEPSSTVPLSATFGSGFSATDSLSLNMKGSALESLGPGSGSAAIFGIDVNHVDFAFIDDFGELLAADGENEDSDAAEIDNIETIDESYDLFEDELDSSVGLLSAADDQSHDSHLSAAAPVFPATEHELRSEPEAGGQTYASSIFSGSSEHSGQDDQVADGDAASTNNSANEAASNSTASTGTYIWPANGTLTSRFGHRDTSVGSTDHKGIDISGRSGDPIFASDGGEVIVSGWSKSFGYVVQLKHDNGHVTLYSHCSALLVSVGERVSQGQEIARMGRTGIASGVHLHFELIVNGTNVNPLRYLPSI